MTPGHPRKMQQLIFSTHAISQSCACQVPRHLLFVVHFKDICKSLIAAHTRSANRVWAEKADVDTHAGGFVRHSRKRRNNRWIETKCDISSFGGFLNFHADCNGKINIMRFVNDFSSPDLCWSPCVVDLCIASSQSVETTTEFWEQTDRHQVMIVTLFLVLS